MQPSPHDSIPAGQEHVPVAASAHSWPASQQFSPQIVIVSGQTHWQVAASSSNGGSHAKPGHGVGVAVVAVALVLPLAGVVGWLAAGSICQLPVSPSSGPPNTPESAPEHVSISFSPVP